MDSGLVYERGGDTVLSGCANFHMGQIADSGQCFRWARTGENTWEGVALGRVCRVEQAPDRVILRGVPLEAYEGLWRDYFDLARDYGAIRRGMEAEPVLRAAADFAPGIRALRQDGWEALCTFILSQNNNIPRIRGLVERLCGHFGRPLGDGRAAFPAPEDLACLDADGLAPVRAGFRAKYVVDCAKRIASGALDFGAVAAAPLEEARAMLMTVHGVGPKVADCALLYGFGRAECVPKDVWINRALAALFPDGLPEHLAPVHGIVQQYLFHYVRARPEVLAGETV